MIIVGIKVRMKVKIKIKNKMDKLPYYIMFMKIIKIGQKMINFPKNF